MGVAPNPGTINIGVFLKLLAVEIQKTMPSGSPELDTLQQLLTQIETETFHQNRISPQSKPATAHWPQALEEMREGPSAALFPALKTLSDQLCWMQNPNFRLPKCSSRFLENYAYSELVGSNGMCPSWKVSMGILLLGPDTFYPPHTHPSSKWLYVLSGRGTWNVENGPTISLPPGKAVFIPHGCTHAFWSMSRPLASIYLCSGNVAVYPRLKPMGFSGVEPP